MLTLKEAIAAAKCARNYPRGINPQAWGYGPMEIPEDSDYPDDFPFPKDFSKEERDQYG